MENLEDFTENFEDYIDDDALFQCLVIGKMMEVIEFLGKLSQSGYGHLRPDLAIQLYLRRN